MIAGITVAKPAEVAFSLPTRRCARLFARMVQSHKPGGPAMTTPEADHHRGHPHRLGTVPVGLPFSHGPCRWIRHPMYSAVALCAAAGAWAASGTWGGCGRLLTARLLAVLWTKAVLEERWMALQHPDDAAYQAGTKRFIPGLL